MKPLAGTYLCGLLFALIFPNAVQHVALVSGRMDPAHWHTFLTYWLLHVGLLHWMQVVAFTALPLLVLIARMSDWELLTLAAISVVLGGLLFALTHPGDAVLIGGSMATWGLAGAVVGWWLRDRRSLGALAQVYAVLLTVVILGTLLSDSALERAQALTGVVGALGIYGYASLGSRMRGGGGSRLAGTSRDDETGNGANFA